MKRILLFIALFIFSSSAFAARNFSGQVLGTDAVCTDFVVTSEAGVATLTCVPGGSPPGGAPQGCVATVNSSTSATLSSAGGSVTLAASCTNPSSGLSFNWSRNGAFGANATSSWSDSLPANTNQTVDQVYRYQSRICTGANCTTVPASPLAATVTHASGGGGPSTCGGFTDTINLEFNWNAPGRIYASGMSPTTAVVVKFTTGNFDSANNNLPRISAAEWGTPPSARFAVLSATPCDFSNVQTWQGAVTAGNSVQVPFAVGSGNNWNFYPILAKNTTYYFNLKNLSPTESCSAQGFCGMFIELSKPAGL